MDLVTAEDWCGMLGGCTLCVLVCCVMCMLGMSASPPSEPENTRTHTGGEEERKCGEDEKEIQKEK